MPAAGVPPARRLLCRRAPIRLLAIFAITLALLALGALLVAASAPPSPAATPAQTSYALTKTLTSTNPSRPTYPINFTIRITNTGNSWITVLPLSDIYDPAYLTFSLCGAEGAANVAPDDSTDDGHLDWSDLTAPAPHGFGTDLAPGMSFAVTMTFSGLRDTSILYGGVTLNGASVHDGWADPDGPAGPLPADEPLPAQTASAPASIFVPTCALVRTAGVSLAAPVAAECMNRFSGTIWSDTNLNGEMYVDREENNGINGVRVNEYRDDGDFVFEPDTDDVLFDTALTSNNPDIPNGPPGQYELTAPRDDYCTLTDIWIDVDPANFAPGGALAGMALTSRHTYGPPPKRYFPSGITWLPNPEEGHFGYGVAGDYSFGATYQPPPVKIGQSFDIPVTITNTGDTVITTLPLTVEYDPVYLTYTGATPASDDNKNDGRIDWKDVLNSGAARTATRTAAVTLDPGKSVAVQLHFVGALDTTLLPLGVTQITTSSHGAYADPDGPAGPLDAVGPLPGRYGTASIAIYWPTGVDLARVAIERDSGAVKLTWETANEASILGFNVLRRKPGETTYAAANEDLILAAYAGLDRSASYRYDDLGREMEGAGYALEVVFLDGRRERHELR